MLKNGQHGEDLRIKANEQATQELLDEGVLKEEDLDYRGGNITSTKQDTYKSPTGDKFILWLERRNSILDTLTKEVGGVRDDSSH